MSRPSDITVRETIHHGDYYNVREQTVEASFAGIVKLLQASPYNGGQTLEQYAGNNYVTRMAARLLINGVGEFGWARYENVDRCTDHQFTHKTETHTICDVCGECDEDQ